MNPWVNIALTDYETHMNSTDVFQLQTLNEIMLEQSADYKSEVVTVLGVAGGNGLEHFGNANSIYAVDINADFLEQCSKRYSNLGDKLHLVCCDLENADLPPSHLLVCNLIIEYIGTTAFSSLLQRTNFNVVSCVIQKNYGNAFVSTSKTADKLSSLDLFHQDIDRNELVERLDLKLVLEKEYRLPNNKAFVRLDFIRS